MNTIRQVILFILILATQAGSAQKYFSKTGKITFTSKAPLETIEATNSSASTVIDLATGSMEWAVLIRGFSFQKELMQEHFNENYMESSKYPKAKFKGTIDNINALDLTKEGEYKINVPGQLEIHGVTQPITAQGTLILRNGQISAKSRIAIAVADYGIEIPRLVADNIAKKVDITIEAVYQVMVAIP